MHDDKDGIFFSVSSLPKTLGGGPYDNPDTLDYAYTFTLKVIAADVQDRDGVKLHIQHLVVSFGWLKLIWADGGYVCHLVTHVAKIAGIAK